jgi:hypothetical protein
LRGVYPALCVLGIALSIAVSSLGIMRPIERKLAADKPVTEINTGTVSTGGNTKIGVAVAPAANPSSTGNVRLNGVF